MWLLIKWTETNRRFMMDSQLLLSSLEIPFFFYSRRTSVEFYPILELLIKKKNLKRYSHLKGRLGKDVDISLWNDTITNIISFSTIR
ncbi:unnamed protein product [Rhizophagus irregularis]|nr:unnamed protein product [Rhizophagus irregularis]